MAKGSKRKPSESQKAAYTAYKAQNRAQKNKQRKLERHQRKHPNDAQAQAVKSASGHVRKTPKGAGPAVKPGGYQIVGYEKVKHPKTGKMVDRPVFQYMTEVPKHLPKSLRQPDIGSFYRLENRVAL